DISPSRGEIGNTVAAAFLATPTVGESCDDGAISPTGGEIGRHCCFRQSPALKKQAIGEVANLPPSGGDVRQDRGGRCPADLRRQHRNFKGRNKKTRLSGRVFGANWHHT
ncbi:hypothetical protein NKH84_25330, partial [Mesorhizobium sp. M0902]|uniref:hypothetical protein n=1 Tax=Mesorhizobium sp. M0902 TaxID=2957021 RepID=UPI00333C9180